MKLARFVLQEIERYRLGDSEHHLIPCLKYGTNYIRYKPYELLTIARIVLTDVDIIDDIRRMPVSVLIDRTYGYQIEHHTRLIYLGRK